MNSDQTLKYPSTDRVEFLERQIEELRISHEAEKKLILSKIRTPAQPLIPASGSSSLELPFPMPERAVWTYSKLWRKRWKRFAIRVFFRLLGGRMRL